MDWKTVSYSSTHCVMWTLNGIPYY